MTGKINQQWLQQLKGKITIKALWLFASNSSKLTFQQAKSIAAKELAAEAKSERQFANMVRPQPSDTAAGGYKDLLFDKLLAMRQRSSDQDAPHPEPKNAPTALKPVLYLASDNTSEPKPKPTEPWPAPGLDDTQLS